MEVELGIHWSRAGHCARHQVRELEPHPGGECSRVGAPEGDPGTEAVLVAHGGDEVCRVLQCLSAPIR